MRRRGGQHPAHDNCSHITLENSLFQEVRGEPMRGVLESAKRAAASDATILLIGESGTGKSLLARQIHFWSPRREKPFISIDCIRLAQMSARVQKHAPLIKNPLVEQFEAADGGTLFLSAIDQLSPSFQIEVARFVLHHTLRTSDGENPVDVRIIAATDRELAPLVENHQFREDLFYELDIVTLHLPPLRERVVDIPALAESMLETAAIRNGRSRLHLSSEAAAVIRRYSWPGNVRELRNAMEAAAVLCETDTVTVANLPEAIRRQISANSMSISPRTSLDEIERQQIVRVLSESPTLGKAAATLGIHITTLYRKRKRYKLDLIAASKAK
jgi:two-component system, NtrC family, response regulator AlgB